MERTIAIRQAEDAAKAWTFHVKQCAACTGALRDDRPARICDEGWPLGSAEARTRVALDLLRERRKAAPDDTQMELF
jgi:hypothetical protein